MSSLSIVWSFNVSPSNSERFSSLVPEEEVRVIELVYNKNRVSHSWMEIATHDQETGKIWVRLRYEVQPESRPSTSSSADHSELYFFLRDEEPECVAGCEVEFDFPDSPSIRTVFPLPFVLNTSSEFSVPLDEIRGIRGVKFGDDGTQEISYNFIMDRPYNEDLWLLVKFNLSNVDPEMVPHEALARAKGIAASIVLQD